MDKNMESEMKTELIQGLTRIVTYCRHELVGCGNCALPLVSQYKTAPQMQHGQEKPLCRPPTYCSHGHIRWDLGEVKVYLDVPYNLS